jgi:predicted ATPase
MSLLTEGARDLPERQRTLRNTLDWSFGLLSPAGQALLSRLGVFPGTFDLEAAEAVGGAQGAAPADEDQAGEIIDTLGSLVDASLVRHAECTGRRRFSLLETIREYTRERLRESGQWKEAHDRHAAHSWNSPSPPGPGWKVAARWPGWTGWKPSTITSVPRRPGSWTRASPGRRSS